MFVGSNAAKWPVLGYNVQVDATALNGSFERVFAQREDEDAHTIVGRDALGRIVVQARGEWVGAHAEAVIEGLDAAAAEGADVGPVYWDLAGVAHYQSALRKEITRWLVANYQRLDRNHYLVATNSLVAMGASTAGLALSVVGVRVHVTRDLAQFRQWFDAATGTR